MSSEPTPEPGTLDYLYYLIDKSVAASIKLAASGRMEIAETMRELTMDLVRQVPLRIQFERVTKGASL